MQTYDVKVYKEVENSDNQPILVEAETIRNLSLVQVTVIEQLLDRIGISYNRFRNHVKPLIPESGEVKPDIPY